MVILHTESKSYEIIEDDGSKYSFPSDNPTHEGHERISNWVEEGNKVTEKED